MNKEQEELLNDAYKNYLIEDAKVLPNMSKEKMAEMGFRLSKEEFINKIKTDDEFAKKWGVVYEERKLSEEERIEMIRPYGMDALIHAVFWLQCISITYNNKTIESYE